MNRELIIALAASLALHAAFIFGGQLFKSAPAPKVVTEEIPVIALMPLPPVEPEQPEIIEPSESAAAGEMSNLVPPMQADLPSVVLDSPFVQQIQPLPPPGLNQLTGTIPIPLGRPGGAGGTSLSTIFDLGSLDQDPVATFQPKPIYPYELRRLGVTGEVQLGFIVTAAGTVRDPYIIRSSRREFEDAALQAVLKWKFRPGKKAGAAVNTRVTILFPFGIGSN
jgi:periplasmic protein TonB